MVAERMFSNGISSVDILVVLSSVCVYSYCVIISELLF